jgi:hypothetical protein
LVLARVCPVDGACVASSVPTAAVLSFGRSI